ncbi:MAG: phage tail family protein [Clostridia bacterium]|nr:phage tail family protein [Clostridia bacterium]
MTKNFLDITLECNGNTLTFGMSPEGKKREFGITKYTGLESSDLEISKSDNALVDGSTVDGKKIKDRSVHLEATLRKAGSDNAENRQRIIKFFNPKYTGKMTVNMSGTERNIEYEIEGWTFKEKKNVDNRLSISVDLTCPDPFMRNIDNFGKNMADFTPLFAFPWMVLPAKSYNTPDPYKGLTLYGQVAGYRTLNTNVLLTNDGDVPCGLQIKFVASRGSVTGPKITHLGTGSYMHVNISMNQGDELLIDTDDRNQIIELNGENVYQYIDRLSNPFKLEVGENYLEYDADDNYTNLDVMLYFTPLYLGV